jgi:NADH:ubiquinone oxidoreductase subunit 2 (subunit N)
MYLTIELLSLPLYALAAIKTRSLLSTEAGLKYFILGAFSSGVFLFVISLFYLSTVILSFSEIGQFVIRGYSECASFGITSGLSGSIHSAYLIGMCLILVGLLFKLTAVPFHM